MSSNEEKTRNSHINFVNCHFINSCNIVGKFTLRSRRKKLFTYPLLIVNKTYTVTVETNWNQEHAPSVALLNSSKNHYPLELYFLGGTQEKNISYTINIPTNLLWGNISLIRKYYTVNPDNYTLSSNGTHNCLQMTFEYHPFFSGNGYFEIIGTQGAWQGYYSSTS